MGGKGSGGRRYRAGRKGVSAAADLATAAARVAIESETGDDEAETEDDSGVALLPEISPATAALVDHVWVQRIGPVKEGVLGELQPDEDVDEIQRRWGGGKYKLVGRTSANKLLVGAFRSVEVSGEPKFKSKAAELEYRRQVGDPDGGNGSRAPAAPPATAALDVLALMGKQEDREESRHRRDLEYLREQAAQREKERIAADERREKERRADDERRERDRKADEERDRRHTEEARSRDREFFTAMLKMSKESGGGQLDVLKTGIDLALKLRPESDGAGADPLSAVLAGIPMLAELFKGAASQAAPAPAAAPQLPPQGAPRAPQVASGGAPAQEPGPSKRRKESNGVVLEGPLGDKARAAIRNLTARGVDPEKAFAEVMDRLAALAGPPPPAPSAPPVAPAPSSPAPAVAAELEAPAPNGVQVDAASSGTSPGESVRPEG